MNEQAPKRTLIDLHIHSDKSDGTFSPREIVDIAKAESLNVISLTDHDTVEGCREALKYLESNPEPTLQLISGIEMSVENKGGTLHILGYHLDIDNNPLLATLKELHDIRQNRNLEIIKKLKQIAIDIDPSELDSVTSNNISQGRPHIAKLMLARGFVESIDQAFDEFLSQSGKAYVPKKLLPPGETIDLIHNAGGIAVLAHPATLNRHGVDFEQKLEELISLGLDGIEVYAPLHGQIQVDTYLDLAQKHGLCISGGSDFHGSVKPQIDIGHCFNHQLLDSSKVSELLMPQTFPSKQD